eukprot:gene8301-9185_t
MENDKDNESKNSLLDINVTEMLQVAIRRIELLEKRHLQHVQPSSSDIGTLVNLPGPSQPYQSNPSANANNADNSRSSVNTYKPTMLQRNNSILPSLLTSGNNFRAAINEDFSWETLPMCSSKPAIRVKFLPDDDIHELPTASACLKVLRTPTVHSAQKNFRSAMMPKDHSSLYHKSIPDEITLLKNLERLDIRNNSIPGLPAIMGNMESIKSLSLDGNPLRGIRRDIVSNGTQSVLKYLRSRIKPTDSNDLYALHTKLVASQDALKNLHQIHDIGKSQFEVFVHKRLWTSSKPTLALFSRLFIACQARDGNLLAPVVDVKIFDGPALSLKGRTRSNRGAVIRRKVTSNGVLPKNWATLLLCSENKTELFPYLSRHVIDEAASTKQFVATHDENVLYNNHIDSDVIVIAVAASHKIRGLTELWVEFGAGKSLGFIAVHEIASSLGKAKSNAFLFFHAVSGCDTNLSVAGKAKKSFYDASGLLPDVTTVFESLVTVSDREEILAEDHKLLKRYFVVLYSPTCNTHNVNITRRLLFTQGRSIENIPPMKQHVQRAALQGSSWYRCLENGRITIWGWKRSGTGYLPFWSELPEPLLLAVFLLIVAASCRAKDIVSVVAKNFLALNSVLDSVRIET